MSRRPVVPDVPGRAAKSPHARIVAGEVIGYLPGTNRLMIRTSGAAGRAFRNVIAVEGVTFRAGDRALLARVPNETAWIAVAKWDDTREYGASVSQGLGADALFPPSNFTVKGFSDLIAAEWEGWAGNTDYF
jgi:hypothetical protein